MSDAAVFDLKAVNPRARVVMADRTPVQVRESIAAQGLQLDEALNRLRAALAGM